MPVYRKERTLSEKATSVEQRIEVKQKGIITFVPKSGRVLGIPTNIPVVTGLKLTAMSQLSASALLLTGGWWSDLHKVKAASVYNCFASIASTSLLAETGKRLRMTSDYALYTCIASMAATTAASNSRIASSSFARFEESFASTDYCYIMVNINNAASTSFKAKKQKIAYEVTGYEY